MGNISVNISDMESYLNADDSSSSSSSDSDREYFGNSNDDSLGENYLILILRQLIQSREIQLLNSSDEDTLYTAKLPVIKKEPSLEKLQNSAIYQSIKQASGFKSDSTSPGSRWSLLKMLSSRQNGLGPKHGSFSQNERCKIFNNKIPNRREKHLIKFHTKVFCGVFSKDGDYFITASQDHKIRVFDATTSNYYRINRLAANDVSWSILDLDFSPDGQHFVYSTWSNSLYLSKIHGSSDELKNLLLRSETSRFCIFSVAFSNCGKELIGGANDGCLYIYDRHIDRKTLKVPVNSQKLDVNSVGFADETSNIFFSGGDDCIIKIWDRRCLNEVQPEPVGKLIGHFDGITSINSRNDARYIISNSKDQSIKLWDLRKFAPKEYIGTRDGHLKPWDYRWDSVPKIYYNPPKQYDEDTSVMTYRGHKVQKSLIRAKFSPVATTGQRYIYTGCGTGRVIIYDVLTGKIAQAIEGHTDIVRDVAWHPKRNEILSCGWDYHVNLNTWLTSDSRKPVKAGNRRSRNLQEEEEDVPRPPLRRSRRLAERNGGEGTSGTQ